jgi:hypothetical protein
MVIVVVIDDRTRASQVPVHAGSPPDGWLFTPSFPMMSPRVVMQGHHAAP